MSDLLKDAWRLRTAQKVEECLIALAPLRVALGIPARALDEKTVFELIGRAEQPAVMADALLLIASLARARGELQNSSTLIEAVSAALGTSPIGTRHYHLRSERGLTSFLRGDYVVALEEFLAAATLSDDPWEKGKSLQNALFCLENLGLPYARTLTDVEKVLRIPADRFEKEAMVAQQQAFLARQAFREGQLEEALSGTFSADAESPELTQLTYYRLWLRQLPYHRNWQPFTPAQIAPHLASSRHFHRKLFRLRTLEGILNPEDLNETKPSELVDRLYLWVWRWLSDPEAFSILRIMPHLSRLLNADTLHLLTVEDAQLLANSLRWLMLFDSTSEDLTRRLLGAIARPAGAEFPLLSFEKAVIQYFVAAKSGDRLLAADLRASLKGHPLWHSEQLHLAALVEAVTRAAPAPGPLKTLSNNIRSLLPRAAGQLKARYSVNPVRHELLDKKNSRKLLSEPMSRALELLHTKGTVSCEEFCHQVFGLRQYDSLIHAPKIFNLLSRMRVFFQGTLRFKVKSGFVLADGDWRVIHFEEGNLASRELQRQHEWKTLLFRMGSYSNSAQPTLTPMASRARTVEIQEVIRREDLESAAGISRSAANRLLAGWRAQGLLTQEGSARKTRYRLSESLREKLRNGEAAL